MAVFTELYPPSIGGQELFFEGLARAMIRRGHTVDIFCIGHSEGLPAHSEVTGIRIHRFPQAPNYLNPARPWMKRAWSVIFRYALSVRRVALSGNYDVHILNQWPLLHVPLLPRAARRKAALHWCEIRNGKLFSVLQRWLPRLVRLNLAISDAVGDAIRETSGRDVLTVPSGLDLAAYSCLPRSERSGILALGRVAEHKNLPFLIAAFEELKRQGYNGRLTLAGDGPDMPAVRARVAASPARGEIDLLGRTDESRKISLLASAAVLAVPSRREGFPRVVAEAMASGLPVVTADYPENGTRHVVSRYGCGVTTGANAAAFAAGVNAAILDWERYSTAGLSSAASLDWDRIAADLETHIMRSLA